VGNESIDRGRWNVYYLFLHDIKFDKNIEQCPRTVEIIEKLVPRQYNHAFFSAMNPGTHIMKHHGPTNKKLRLHIPLVGVEGAKMRVHTDTRNLVQDQVSFTNPPKCLHKIDLNFSHTYLTIVSSTKHGMMETKHALSLSWISGILI
jgi:aspartate beta-hydroxylase